MGGCSSSITHREINISTKEVLNLGHAQELWGETSWYHTETADHEWKKITSKLSASPTFHTEGTATNYIPKQVREGRKAFQNILLENLPGMIFSSSLYRWAQAAPPSPQFPASFCESLLWWDSDRSKAIGYKCGTRTDLNPSHTHCVSFYSWKFPGKWNRTFQLYIVYTGPFKKGENLEHSQKLYIKLKKKINTSVCIFTTQQSLTARFPSRHTGTDLGLLQHNCLKIWFFNSRRSWQYLNVAFYICCTDATESLIARGEAGVVAEGWEKATELLLRIHLHSHRTKICSVTHCTQYTMQYSWYAVYPFSFSWLLSAEIPNSYLITTESSSRLPLLPTCPRFLFCDDVIYNTWEVAGFIAL